MDPPSLCFLSVLILLCYQHAWSNQDWWGCVPSELASVYYTCSFEVDTCSWRNNGVNVAWKRELFRPYVMAATFTGNIGQGKSALFSTSSICSSVQYHYSLKFKYRMEMDWNDLCQLSVYTIGQDVSVPWVKSKRTRWELTAVTYNISVSTDFQLVFEAEALQSGWCRVSIDEVFLQHEYITTSTRTTQPAPTTTTPQISSLETEKPPGSQTTPHAISPSMSSEAATSAMASLAPPLTNPQSQDGPTAGALIGIVIGTVLLAVIVVVCTGVILVARRKAYGREVRLPWIFKNPLKHSSAAEPRNGVFAVANSAFVSGDECTAVHEHTTKEPRVQNGMKQKRGDTTEYELAAVIGSDGGYSTLDDVDLKAGRREQQSTGRIDFDGSKGSDYNKLSFQASSSAAVKTTQDTYNHLQDQDNVYNVPRCEDSEYALAGNPDKPDAQLPANGAQNQHCVNVDERGKTFHAVEADTDYNHLNIKTGHPSVTERRSPPSDVYNHLDEADQAQPSQQADDEYNRVDFNGRPRVTGEADDDATYNHLDTLQG